MHISSIPDPSGLYALSFISSKENVSEEVRSFLIETHLNTTDPFLFIPSSSERRSLTRWEWMKLSLRQGEWNSSLFVATKVALCVSRFLFGLCALFLMSVNILEPKRHYLHTILLKKVDVSLVEAVTKNHKEKGQFLDPISLDPLPQSPSTLVVGAYAMHASDVIVLTLKSKPAEEGKIIHPIEPRFLNAQEKEKLLKELSHLLCTPKEALASCWQPDRREFEEYINSVASEKYALLWQDMGEPGRREIRGAIRPLLFPYFREKKFLSLLPKPIADKYFPWLNDFQAIELPEIAL